MSNLDVQRRAGFEMRRKGIPGGNNISWTTKDLVELEEAYMSAPEDVIRAASTTTKTATLEPLPTSPTFSIGGITVTRDAQASDLSFLARFTKRVPDLVNDIVYEVDCSGFNSNPVVAPFHDTSVLPIATSSPPYMSGDSLLGVLNFPQPGVSAASDEIANAIRAKLIRGISIGFVPLKWKVSTDPARPMGLDFLSVRLLEVSICSVPCCSPCMILGAVSSNSSTSRSATTRDQRMAEARKLIRSVGLHAKA
jgi:hypothetical protein